MTVEASSSKCAHPPRLNRPRSSSSGPPGSCMTPSTETCAVVVSFMVAVPFSLGFVVVRLDGPRRRSHRSQQSPSGRSIPHPPRHTASVDDVVLLNVHPVHSQALFRVRAAAAESLQAPPATPSAPKMLTRPGSTRFPVGGAVEPAPHHLCPGL